MLTKESLVEILKNYSLDNNEIIKKSLQIAQNAHEGQKRDDGSDYLEAHIYPLAQSVVYRYHKEQDIIFLLSTIILHDVLENSDTKVSELQYQVGDEITDMVLKLTKTPEENAHELPQMTKMMMNKRYIDRIKMGNKEIVVLKLEDRLANLISTNKKAVDNKPEKYKRYMLETRELFFPLARSIKNGIDYENLLLHEVERIEKLL